MRFQRIPVNFYDFPFNFGSKSQEISQIQPNSTKFLQFDPISVNFSSVFENLPLTLTISQNRILLQHFVSLLETLQTERNHVIDHHRSTAVSIWYASVLASSARIQTAPIHHHQRVQHEPTPSNSISIVQKTCGWSKESVTNSFYVLSQKPFSYACQYMVLYLSESIVPLFPRIV